MIYPSNSFHSANSLNHTGTKCYLRKIPGIALTLLHCSLCANCRICSCHSQLWLCQLWYCPNQHSLSLYHGSSDSPVSLLSFLLPIPAIVSWLILQMPGVQSGIFEVVRLRLFGRSGKVIPSVVDVVCLEVGRSALGWVRRVCIDMGSLHIIAIRLCINSASLATRRYPRKSWTY